MNTPSIELQLSTVKQELVFLQFQFKYARPVRWGGGTWLQFRIIATEWHHCSESLLWKAGWDQKILFLPPPCCPPLCSSSSFSPSPLLHFSSSSLPSSFSLPLLPSVDVSDTVSIIFPEALERKTPSRTLYPRHLDL